MSKRDAWLATFPTPEAKQAVSLLHEAWHELAATHKDHFNPGTKEPDLTLVLKMYLRDVASPRMRLLGNWGAEDVGAKIDYSTGKITERYRTDIRYVWNSARVKLDLIFEFKKLDHTESSRQTYVGERGMLRFVTGNYSTKQPVALMAGILLSTEPDCVPPLKLSLQSPGVAADLSMRKTVKGEWLHVPLFSGSVSFDTEHVRPPEKAPTHGTIRIGHMFLPFGYESPKATRKREKTATMARLDEND